MTDRIFTTAEKAARVAEVVRHLRAADGDTRHLDRLDALNERGRERAIRQIAAWQVEVEAAKNELAAARVAERSASRAERADARRARREAEKHLKRVERARPKH